MFYLIYFIIFFSLFTYYFTSYYFFSHSAFTVFIVFEITLISFTVFLFSDDRYNDTKLMVAYFLFTSVVLTFIFFFLTEVSISGIPIIFGISFTFKFLYF